MECICIAAWHTTQFFTSMYFKYENKGFFVLGVAFHSTESNNGKIHWDDPTRDMRTEEEGDWWDIKVESTTYAHLNKL